MSVEKQGSVSIALAIFKGEKASEDLDQAVKVLWERYFHQLVSLARARLQNLELAGGGLNNPEDVALSAFHSFCKRAAAGLFPQLNDRHGLWKLLMTITSRKAAREYRRNGPPLEPYLALEQVIGKEPTPEFAALVAEQCRLLLDALPDPAQRTVALMKLEGYTNEEIASNLGFHVTTVERKLKIIRTTWSDHIPV